MLKKSPEGGTEKFEPRRGKVEGEGKDYFHFRQGTRPWMTLCNLTDIFCSLSNDDNDGTIQFGMLKNSCKE